MSTIPSESLKARVRPPDEASLATIPSLGLLLAPPMAVPEVEFAKVAGSESGQLDVGL